MMLPKQGRHPVGVARQYCAVPGELANCQYPASLTLARQEVPVLAALRLCLPELWASGTQRTALRRAVTDGEFSDRSPIAGIARIAVSRRRDIRG